MRDRRSDLKGDDCFRAVRFVRTIALLFALALLAACSAQQRAQERCDRAASHEVQFTGGEEADVIEARTFGIDCGAAIAVFAVRAGDGLPIYAWAAPLHPNFGPSFAPRGEGGPQIEEIDAFLERWSTLSAARTNAAPAWSETLETPLDQATYEDIRARGAPMLCFLTGVGQETCLYWESAAAASAEFYHRATAAAHP